MRSPVFEADGARLRRLIEAWHPATPGLRDAVGADDVALCWADPPSPALWNHYRRLRRLLAPRQLLMPTPETIAALARRAPRGDVLFAWIRHDGAGVPPASPFVDPERLATGARWSVARDAPALRVWRLERAR
ncbi:MAG TPA: hypothetical protein VEI02_03635 [Planctomycetota bacterium]|nr:hypothetical protein [Planctomycetota bacterium]